MHKNEELGPYQQQNGAKELEISRKMGLWSSQEQ